MKCPYCGGEIQPGSKFCTFCGSQISYDMRREQERVNKQGCPKCGSTNVQFQRENQGEFHNADSKQVFIRTIGFCGDCGYTWYPKIDNSDELKNLYELARRALGTRDHEKAAEYYNMILIKEPSSWEAYFFAIYSEFMSCTLGELYSKAKKVGYSIKHTLRLIADNVKDGDEKRKAIEGVRIHIFHFSEVLAKASQDYFDKITSATQDLPTIDKTEYESELATSQMLAKAVKAGFFIELVDAFKNDDEVMNPYGINLLKCRIEEGLQQKAIDEFSAVIMKYDPSYVKPGLESKPQLTSTSSYSSSSKGGCYVATAVYGSYDCPEVWTLRRYRDYELAETWYGRAFIRTYYAISPTLVKWFGHTEWFKKMWRGQLDRMVKSLQDKGYESTPYEDRKW